MNSGCGHLFLNSLRLFCLFGLSIAGQLNAQIDEGAVSGIITDQIGQVMVHAEVTLFNHQTAVLYTCKTNTSGFYNFTNIKMGSYILVISAPGFEPYVKQGIRINRGMNIGESSSLKPIQPEETISEMSGKAQNEGTQMAPPSSPQGANNGPTLGQNPSNTLGSGTIALAKYDANAVPVAPANPQKIGRKNLEIRRGNVTLELFGKLDADGEWVHSSAPETGVASSRIRIASNASRFGVRGMAEIDKNFRAVWQIASRVSLNGTETGGGGGLFTLWGNSRVGLATAYGTVFVGVWDTPYRQSYDFVDQYDGSHIASPIALLGSIGNGISRATTLPTIEHGFPEALAGARVGSTNFYRRQKNSLQYWSPQIRNIEFRLGYSLDDSEVKTSGINPSLLSASLTYIKDPLYVSAAFEQHKDMKALSSGSEAGIDYGTRLTASYRMEGLRLSLVGEHLSYHIRGSPRISRDAVSVSGTYKIKTQSLGAAYTYAADLSGAPNTGARQISLRYGYSLSDFSELFAQYVVINNRRYGTYNFGDGLDISTRPGATLSGAGIGFAFKF